MSTTPKYTVARQTAERERRREAARLRRLAVRQAELERRQALRRASRHAERSEGSGPSALVAGARTPASSADERRRAGTTRRSSVPRRSATLDASRHSDAPVLVDEVEALAAECHRVGFASVALDDLRSRAARLAASEAADAEIANLRARCAEVGAQLDEWIDGQERLTEIMGALAEAFHDGGFWVADPEPGAEGFVVHTTTGTSIDVAVTVVADGSCEVRYHAEGADLQTEVVDGVAVHTCDGLEALLESVHDHAAGHGIEMDGLTWAGKPGPTTRSNDIAQAPPAPRERSAD